MFCVRSRMLDIIILKSRDNMRLNIRKINNYSYYSIIKDYTNLDGKRTTKIFEKFGNQD